MRIKKYVARDFHSALMQAKSEMGREAIILHSRQIKRKGLLGIIYPHQVEITVAADDTLQVNTDIMRGRLAENGAKPGDDLQPKEGRPKPPGNSEIELLNELQRMKELMADIKDKMFEVDSIKGMSENLKYYYDALVKNNVDRKIALEILHNVEAKLPGNGDDTWVRDMCLHTIHEYLKDIQPLQIEHKNEGYLAVFVGPTGVGKTTTIAKLAANMTFLEGKEVALITLDTYRISAAEQLRTFAEIIGIPISVVFTPQELKEAVEEFKNKDIIFVDTAGRSPHNHEHMEELREFIEVANPGEVILVLSVTTSTSDLVNIYRQFAPISIDKVVFTKLDETYSYGQIINTVNEINKPIAYFTTGQNVPDDIEVPDALHISRMLLRRDGML